MSSLASLPGWYFKSLPTFKGTIDDELLVEDFISQLEAVFAANDITDETQQIALTRTRLAGTALAKATADVKMRAAKKWDDFKIALISTFKIFSQPNPEAFAELNVVQQQPNQSILDYAARVQQLCNRAFHLGSDPTKVQQRIKDMEQFAKMRFMAGLRKEIRRYVAQTRPDSFDDAVNAALREEATEKFINIEEMKAESTPKPEAKADEMSFFTVKAITDLNTAINELQNNVQRLEVSSKAASDHRPRSPSPHNTRREYSRSTSSERDGRSDGRSSIRFYDNRRYDDRSSWRRNDPRSGRSPFRSDRNPYRGGRSPFRGNGRFGDRRGGRQDSSRDRSSSRDRTDYRSRPRMNGQRNGTCFICSSNQHYVRECPYNSYQNAGRQEEGHPTSSRGQPQTQPSAPIQTVQADSYWDQAYGYQYEDSDPKN
jgi:hypothetical protein